MRILREGCIINLYRQELFRRQQHREQQPRIDVVALQNPERTIDNAELSIVRSPRSSLTVVAL